LGRCDDLKDGNDLRGRGEAMVVMFIGVPFVC
jgi:hypothetical protein